ncbi:MAG: ABC transporter ATP-binding protein [Actinomycetota bacterium]
MTTLLAADGLCSGYGRIEVLHGVSLAAPAGSVVAVLGPNGVGKTTLLRTLSGSLPNWSGTIHLDGHRIDGRPAFEVARMGVMLIPEGRGVFPGLSVEDNLTIAGREAGRLDDASRGERLQNTLSMFPLLGDRMSQAAGRLSGGEQRMLALSRAFLSEPRVLLIDEISQGLAPIVVEILFGAIARLKGEGRTIVLVEQYLTYALRLADIVYVMAKGQVVFVGEPTEITGEGVLVGTSGQRGGASRRR